MMKLEMFTFILNDHIACQHVSHINSNLPYWWQQPKDVKN